MSALTQLLEVCQLSADPNSYGFRAKRSTQDAMKQIWLSTCRKNSREWVLEGDIKGCFDNISHQWMYNNIPLDKRILKQWLKSGFVKNQELFPTKSGTPQGGIISPILANMVLDGIEEIVNKHNIEKRKMTNGVSVNLSTRFNFIRYADDWIVTGENPKHLRVIQKEIEEFLNIRGLSLSKEKTHITNIRDGFDFLGFHFRKYPNDKMIVKPTKDSIKSFKSKLKEVFKKYRTAKTEDLINKLNPIIRGWAYYYRFVNSKRIFSYLDNHIWYKSLNWMSRIHQRRGLIKYYPKYFKKYPNYGSDTLYANGKYLFRMSTIPIVEHIKVRADANPFDSKYDLYFTQRFFTLKKLTKF
jgi:RNA-directed DNA polymerase